MPTYDRVVDKFVCGDDFDSFHVLSNVPPGQTVGRAWLTALAASGAILFQKIITPVGVVGQGSITNGVLMNVSLTAAVALDETKITVRPIPVPLDAGMNLTFSNGVTATLTEDAPRDATVLSVRPVSAGIPALTVATFSVVHLLFEITFANSILFTPGVPAEYDVQVQLSSGKISTPEDGVYIGRKGKTSATS